MKEYEDNVGLMLYPLMLYHAKIQIHLKYKKSPRVLLTGLPDQNIKDKTKADGTPPPISTLTMSHFLCPVQRCLCICGSRSPLEPTGLPGLGRTVHMQLVFQERYKIE